jgi:hypothetical protein
MVRATKPSPASPMVSVTIFRELGRLIVYRPGPKRVLSPGERQILNEWIRAQGMDVGPVMYSMP